MTAWIIQLAFGAIAIALILGAYMATRSSRPYSNELTEAFQRAEAVKLEEGFYE